MVTDPRPVPDTKEASQTSSSSEHGITDVKSDGITSCLSSCPPAEGIVSSVRDVLTPKVSIRTMGRIIKSRNSLTQTLTRSQPESSLTHAATPGTTLSLSLLHKTLLIERLAEFHSLSTNISFFSEAGESMVAFEELIFLTRHADFASSQPHC